MVITCCFLAHTLSNPGNRKGFECFQMDSGLLQPVAGTPVYQHQLKIHTLILTILALFFFDVTIAIDTYLILQMRT